MSHLFRIFTLLALSISLGCLLGGCSSSGETSAAGPKPDAQVKVADTKVPAESQEIAKVAAAKQAEMNAMRERDAALALKRK